MPVLVPFSLLGVKSFLMVYCECIALPHYKSEFAFGVVVIVKVHTTFNPFSIDKMRTKHVWKLLNTRSSGHLLYVSPHGKMWSKQQSLIPWIMSFFNYSFTENLSLVIERFRMNKFTVF